MRNRMPWSGLISYFGVVVLEIAMRVSEMAWYQRLSACADRTQTGGSDALAVLG